jgi:hypothetical protein
MNAYRKDSGKKERIAEIATFGWKCSSKLYWTHINAIDINMNLKTI